MAATSSRQPYGTNALEPYVGEIMLFAGNYEVQNFAFCSGQILSIAQNTALFSILGTTYGGNGQTTFGLPDLRGRVPMHFGQGPGLTNHILGERAGSENTTLIQSNMPAHLHTVLGGGISSATATTNSPIGAVPAVLTGTDVNGETVDVKGYAPTATGNYPGGNTGIAGSSTPFSTMQPYLALNYQICLYGVYPSRN
ncbi:hypothetical protein B0919_13840 [Hymenobacter sp. CRA2]|nr:hypothetical protein B0919_13840 [Hymenobacter sp. CRA2]